MLSRKNYTIYTLSIFDRIAVMVRVRFNVQIKYSNSMIYKNSLSASWLLRELSSPRVDWPRVGLSASCPVSVRSRVKLGLRLKCRCWCGWYIILTLFHPLYDLQSATYRPASAVQLNKLANARMQYIHTIRTTTEAAYRLFHDITNYPNKLIRI